MSARCDCGDTQCPSCGTAQGTYRGRTVPTVQIEATDANIDALRTAADVLEGEAAQLRKLGMFNLESDMRGYVLELTLMHAALLLARGRFLAGSGV